MINTRPFLCEVVALLDGHGVKTWVFGGWAEELGGAPARPHKDIDLLYPAESFANVDRLLRETDSVAEITAKRFPHKRAFEFGGVMVELFLVQTDGAQLFTDFWGTTRFDWPGETLLGDLIDGFRVVSAEALAAYRANHDRLAQHSL